MIGAPAGHRGLHHHRGRGTGDLRYPHTQPAQVPPPTRQAVDKDNTACAAKPSTAGCRVPEFVYADSTTAAAGSLGDVKDQVKQLKVWLTDPGASAATSTVVAQYAYACSGLLREAWDPRVTAVQKETYTYDAAGRMATYTSGAELPWTLSYSSGSDVNGPAGRLLKVSRPTLTPGTSGTTNGTATTSVVYGVPISDSAAPYQMDAATVAAWGQSDLPTRAAAVFPTDQVPAANNGTALTAADYRRATITYLDDGMNTLNVAEPGGHISTSESHRHGRRRGVLGPLLPVGLGDLRVDGSRFRGWPQLDEVALAVVADAGFRVIGVAVQAHAHPVSAVRGGGELKGRLLVGPRIQDVARLQCRQVQGGQLWAQAEFLGPLPPVVGLRGGRGVVELDGHPQGAGVGGGQDDGVGVGGRAAAPAEGHLGGVGVVVGEADEVAVLAEFDGERGRTDQHEGLLERAGCLLLRRSGRRHPGWLGGSVARLRRSRRTGRRP
ncbi:hypothetical protein [Streptomyces sp. NPDC021562]|uniref:hypothetical protein n=1 Tax=Streptomyces sp. NPDC021562 TaxID=3155121 RepID=UPI0033D17509